MRLDTQKFVLVILIGVLIGVGGYAFIYAKGYSYLVNDPSACANCHAMNDQYAGWTKSSHHSAATCNDCHTPHNIFGKYAVKASNGFFHSFYFTTGRYPDVIQITKFDREVVESACRNCHAAITQAIDPASGHGTAEGIHCTRCHLSVGHSESSAELRFSFSEIGFSEASIQPSALSNQPNLFTAKCAKDAEEDGIQKSLSSFASLAFVAVKHMQSPAF